MGDPRHIEGRLMSQAGLAVARPRLTLSEGKLLLHGSPARTIFRKSLISVGCADIEPEALRFLLSKYEAWLAGEEYVLQP